MDDKRVNLSDETNLTHGKDVIVDEHDKVIHTEDSSQGGDGSVEQHSEYEATEDNSQGDDSTDDIIEVESGEEPSHEEDSTEDSSELQFSEDDEGTGESSATASKDSVQENKSDAGDNSVDEAHEQSFPEYWQKLTSTLPPSFPPPAQQYTGPRRMRLWQDSSYHTSATLEAFSPDGTGVLPPNPYAIITEATKGQKSLHRMPGNDIDKQPTISNDRYKRISGQLDSLSADFTLPNPLPDLTGQADPNGTLARRKKALESYTAPEAMFDDLPYPKDTLVSHLSAAEKPIHCNYSHLVIGTIKCDECGKKARTEGVYKCRDCLSQMCTECIELQIKRADENPDYFFTWKGTKLHGGFKPAYEQRKAMARIPLIWKGKVTFKSSHDNTYKALVEIDGNSYYKHKLNPSGAEERPLRRKRKPTPGSDDDNDDEEGKLIVFSAPSSPKRRKVGNNNNNVTDDEEPVLDITKAAMGEKSPHYRKLLLIQELAKAKAKLD